MLEGDVTLLVGGDRLPLLTSPSYKVTSPKVMLEGDVTLSGNAFKAKL